MSKGRKDRKLKENAEISRLKCSDPLAADFQDRVNSVTPTHLTSPATNAPARSCLRIGTMCFSNGRISRTMFRGISSAKRYVRERASDILHLPDWTTCRARRRLILRFYETPATAASDVCDIPTPHVFTTPKLLIGSAILGQRILSQSTSRLGCRVWRGSIPSRLNGGVKGRAVIWRAVQLARACASVTRRAVQRSRATRFPSGFERDLEKLQAGSDVIRWVRRVEDYEGRSILHRFEEPEESRRAERRRFRHRVASNSKRPRHGGSRLIIVGKKCDASKLLVDQRYSLHFKRSFTSLIQRALILRDTESKLYLFVITIYNVDLFIYSTCK